MSKMFIDMQDQAAIAVCEHLKKVLDQVIANAKKAVDEREEQLKNDTKDV